MSGWSEDLVRELVDSGVSEFEADLAEIVGRARTESDQAETTRIVRRWAEVAGRRRDGRDSRAPRAAGVRPWLIDAADLLAEPDPGPVPWLVENLIVEQALTACVGRPKTTKSFGMMEVAISVVTGQPAFGELAVPEPGRVVYVIEESGRDALWRRLDALSRGRAIPREELRGLEFATNERVKLDDEDWQERIVEHGLERRPRLIVFDPLARMKAPARDENAQTDTATLIEFMRVLRDEIGAAVAFVHHLGHHGAHMRGSSDLESAWESRLGWTRDDETGVVTIASEHREAEETPELCYRIAWDSTTRTIHFPLVEADDDVRAAVEAFLDKNPDASANDIVSAVGRRRKEVLRIVKAMRSGGSGTTGNHLSEAGPAAGTPEGALPRRGSPSGTGDLRSGTGDGEPRR